MASPRAFARQSYQEPYVRKREDPYFKGLLSGNDKVSVTFDFNYRNNDNQKNISGSISDIGDSKKHGKTLEKLEDLYSTDVDLETIEQFFSIEKTSKVAKTNLPRFSNVGDLLDLTHESPEPTAEMDEQELLVNAPSWPLISREKTFVFSKRKGQLSSLLPQCAASFYNGFSQQIEMVEVCESAKRVNEYLKARKDEINAGLPGKFLHAVMGHDITDVGSVASTISYAFYLYETQSTDQFCTVPIINMKRADLSAHVELVWLLSSCQIDHTLLTFVDEVDLSYYDLFGGLKLVLLKSHKLPAKQEALKDSVVEILTCRSKGQSTYPWIETVTVTEDFSTCTIIAEKFSILSPEFLVGKGFSRLLLAGILSDTGNLSNSQCSSKDKSMATLLLHSAGRLGCNGLYQMLRYKRHDLSDLKVIDILRKDFKRWTRAIGKPDGLKSTVSHIGMSSIAISLSQLIAHEVSATQQIKYFQKLEKLRLLMIVSGYNDSKNNFKREILISAESPDHMKNLLLFFNSNSNYLPLKSLNCQGLLEEMKAFEIDKVTSRKTIERLLEEFGGTSKGTI